MANALRYVKDMKPIFRVATLVFCAALISSCGNSGPDATLVAENQRVIVENTRLRADIAETRKRNDELQTELTNVKQREGILVLSTGAGVVASIALFCVGLAVGMRIRRRHTKNDGPECETDQA